MRDPYDELGVEPTAPVTEIRRAYRRLAQQLHPDHRPEATPEELRAAVEATERLNSAWDVLSDPGRRAGYDASRRRQQGAQPDTDADIDNDRPAVLPRRVSMLPWLILAAVMIAIFVFTAYAGPHTGSVSRPGPAGSLSVATTGRP